MNLELRELAGKAKAGCPVSKLLKADLGHSGFNFPLWIWAAYGEAPATSAVAGGALIIGAVIGHFIYDAQRSSVENARNSAKVV